MQDTDSWEVVVSSLISQLKNIEATLENQNLSVEEYLQQNSDKAESQLLETQLRSTQTSFERMEDKLHDMIIYLCRAMTVSKVHQLSNLLGEVEHGMEQ
jgi:type III secretory pathway component EscR